MLCWDILVLERKDLAGGGRRQQAGQPEDRAARMEDSLPAALRFQRGACACVWAPPTHRACSQGSEYSMSTYRMSNQADTTRKESQRQKASPSLQHDKA